MRVLINDRKQKTKGPAEAQSQARTEARYVGNSWDLETGDPKVTREEKTAPGMAEMRKPGTDLSGHCAALRKVHTSVP